MSLLDAFHTAGWSNREVSSDRALSVSHPHPPEMKRCNRKTLCPSHNTSPGHCRRIAQENPECIAGSNSFCDDNDTKPTAPKHFQTSGELKLPSGTDPAATDSRVGETWRSWGWRVEERDGFHKPNQFGYGPDGYRLQIIVAAREGYRPTLQASTPCFPGTIARDDVDFPMQLQA